MNKILLLCTCITGLVNAGIIENYNDFVRSNNYMHEEIVTEDDFRTGKLLGSPLIGTKVIFHEKEIDTTPFINDDMHYYYSDNTIALFENGNLKTLDIFTDDVIYTITDTETTSSSYFVNGTCQGLNRTTGKENSDSNSINLENIVNYNYTKKDGYYEFFPKCYSGDTGLNSLKLSIAIDRGIYLYEKKSLKNIMSWLERIIAYARVPYIYQLNIRLDIETVYIGNENSGVPLSRGESTCVGAPNAFREFMSWQNPVLERSNNWILLSNCFSGVTGTAYIGSVCDNKIGVSNRGWAVLAHELGHGVGSSHSFEYGVGRTGGIMDYYDQIYEGRYQFHPFKGIEICNYLNQQTCLSPSESVCGDKILGPDEQCECIYGSKKCGSCVNCKLPKGIECNNAKYPESYQSVLGRRGRRGRRGPNNNFIMRYPDTPKYTDIFDSSLYANSECCRKGKLVGPKTTCNKGLGVCSKNGLCDLACGRDFYSWVKVCKFDDSGCTVYCNAFNRCVRSESAVIKDGTKCIMSNGTKSFCNAGICK